MGYIYKVPLEAVQRVEESEINLDRLKKLVTGDDAFNKAMTSHSDPITLDGNNSAPFGKQPLQIIDGRHRIFICQRRNVTHNTFPLVVADCCSSVSSYCFQRSTAIVNQGPGSGGRQR